MSIRLICIGGAAATLALAGPAIAQTAPAPYLEATRYDLGGRVAGKILPDPDGSGPLRFQASRNTYDSYDNVVRVEAGELQDWQSEDVLPANWPNFSVHKVADYSYADLGRQTSEVVSANGAVFSVSQQSYDAMGRPECSAVRMNAAAFGSLPASACTQGTQGPFGSDRITRIQYNANGLPTLIQKGYGTILQQNYATYTYENSPGAAPTTVTDANGNKAAFEFGGPFYEITKWSFPDKLSPGQVSSSDYESYSHDANGNRTSLRKRDGRTFTYNYDALNRVTSKIVPDACVSGYACTNVPASATRDVHYSYDLRGLQTAARFDGPSGADAVTSAYDGFGRLTSSTTSMAGRSWALSFVYDGNGNRTRITHPDGNSFAYEFDGLDRMIAVRENTAQPVVVQTVWGTHGRIASQRRGSVTTTYQYDGVMRPRETSDDLQGTVYDLTTQLSYNPASQIIGRTRSNSRYAFADYLPVNRSYASNGLNQYVSAGPATFLYDSNGNLTSDGTYSFTYDAENRLIASSSGAALTYDPLGRLHETSGGSAGITRFVYDGDQMTVEYDAWGNVWRRYVHGTAEDDPLLWYHDPHLNDRRSIQADHQGSVISIADASGEAMAVHTYDEYGRPGVGNSTSRFQYTGQAWIPELGMYYYKARIYSPTLGRFMQTDPIGYDDQVNLYAYVANDPVNKQDPTGNYGKGAGWDKREKEWKKFDKAQKAAAKDMRKAADGLIGKAGKQTGSQRAATLQKARDLMGGALKLESDGSDGNVASYVEGSDWKGSGNAAARAPIGGNVMFVNGGHEVWKSGGGGPVVQFVVGHESLHSDGRRHAIGPNGQISYRYGSPAQQQAYADVTGTESGNRDPDHLMSEAYP